MVLWLQLNPVELFLQILLFITVVIIQLKVGAGASNVDYYSDDEFLAQAIRGIVFLNKKKGSPGISIIKAAPNMIKEYDPINIQLPKLHKFRPTMCR